MDKTKALSAALSQIERQFGKGSAMKLGKNDRWMDIETISSGSLGLDIALGVDSSEGPTTATVVAATVLRDHEGAATGAPVIARMLDGRHIAAAPADDDVISAAGEQDVPGMVGKVGAIFGQSAFPTSNGLDVTFNSYQWGGGSVGADGIAFMLAAVDPADPVAPTVAASSGGALRQLLPLFSVGLGARLGRGRQYMSWISLEDQVRAVQFAISDSRLSGPVNLTGPAPVTNAEFTAALGRAVNRPTPLMMPGFAVRAALGEFADETLLSGQRAIPALLERAGFEFHHNTVGEALRYATATRDVA